MFSYKSFINFPSIYLVIRIAIDKETRSKISLVKNGCSISYEETLS